MDLIGQIRRAYFDQGPPIKEIVRTLSVSRATVRKVIRGEETTEFRYATRAVQPSPKLGPWIKDLVEILEAEAKLPRRERRSTQRLARRRAGPHCRSSGKPAPRVAFVELDVIAPGRTGGLMAAPSMVFTARFAASSLGVDIEVIEELAKQMEPEDGCLSILESLDENLAFVTGFTRRGLDDLDDLLDDRRSEFMKDI